MGAGRRHPSNLFRAIERLNVCYLFLFFNVQLHELLEIYLWARFIILWFWILTKMALYFSFLHHLKSYGRSWTCYCKANRNGTKQRKVFSKRKINPIQSSTGHLFPSPIKVFILCSSVLFNIRGKFYTCTVCPQFSCLPPNQTSMPKHYIQI